jgi:hypothetical protein
MEMMSSTPAGVVIANKTWLENSDLQCFDASTWYEHEVFAARVCNAWTFNEIAQQLKPGIGQHGVAGEQLLLQALQLRVWIGVWYRAKSVRLEQTRADWDMDWSFGDHQ